MGPRRPHRGHWLARWPVAAVLMAASAVGFGSAPLLLVDVLKSVVAAAIILPVISIEKWHRGCAEVVRSLMTAPDAVV